ncbi:MAG: PHP domain-containing protein [Parcubacteria group bacterium Gr01-1014_30]|nr:MAG: PHP domain-containing protein [Parcubacteria group bacterium Gr01-1014_30]
MTGKADLHVHTHRSADAFSSPRAVLKKAKERGLDLLAITDHDTITGAKEASKIAQEFGIETVMGEEVTTKEGDLLALFIGEEIKPKRSVLETIREVHRQGGLALVPHPGNTVIGGVSLEVLGEIFQEVDAIELLNGGWLGWIKAQESQELNESTFGLTPFGGSDAHLARQVGSAYTEFPGRTAEDLFRAIKNGQTMPAGGSWAYRDTLLLLLNTPRVLYRKPTLAFKVALRAARKTLVL